MHLLILIIGVTLSPKAYALKCYACGDGTPAEHCYFQELGKEIVCPGSHHCAGLVVTAHNMEPYPSGKGYNMKNCLLADQCVSGTVYFGNQHFYENMKCCSTDLCNVNYTDDNHDSFVKNGRKCYTCTNPKDCSNTQTALSCVGDQDRCISAVEHNGVQNENWIGCATKSMCGDVQALLNMLMNISLSEDSTIHCCEGDLCNSVNIVDTTNIKPSGLQASHNLSPGNSAVSLLILVVAPVMLASISW